ncbi:ABC transporter ATP-binding protein [Tessaracoccus massiliensis]|uniref:ABC transporter ATP-binding protein n=1 Tax=Tessaracoccus massiliensis TaxID=1522311 RepID=UPI00058FF869|nr:ABC transporter ATP-binding protein [Tessaracoccus massiliensis]
MSDSTESGLKRTLRVVRPHLGGQKLLMAGGSVSLLAEVVFRVLEPWPLKFVIDAVSRSLGADLAQDGPVATVRLLLLAALATLLIVGLRALTNYLATVAFALAGSRIATRLRAHVFDHTQRLSAAYHSTRQSGDTVQRLVADVGRLQEVAVSAGLPLLANIATLTVMTGVMFWLDPLLALVVVCAAGLFFLQSRRSGPRITSAARKTRKGEGALANTAQETLGAIKVVQAYGLEQVVRERFGSANNRSLKEGVKSRRLAAALERKTDVVVGLATASVIAFGGWRVLEGSMTPGDLVLFTTYLKTAMKPLRDLAKYTGRIARATASGERVADLMETRIDIADPKDPVELEHVRGDISLSRVTATYDGYPALRGLSLDIRAGQKVALVGPSGSGKSTLASLLVRSMDPVLGTVSLDGVDLRQIRVADLRRHVALVLQDSVLFTGSIADNIRYGRLGATDDEVEEAGRLAQLDSWVRSLPDGYDTPVGERGSTISGGQRQRIAIARALLRDASIVVLDEALAGLDPANAAEVRGAINRLTEGRTTISITHDAPSALAADRVLWVEDGSVLHDGAPDQLLADPDSPFAGWLERQRQSLGEPGPLGVAR